MRTEQWLRERPIRAERVINSDRTAGRLSIGTIWSALRELSDDSTAEEDVRLLATVIGCLDVDEYLHLVNEAVRQLTRESQAALERIELRVHERIEYLQGQQGTRHHEPGKFSVAEVRESERPHSLSQIMATVAIVQSLIWALAPPDEPQRLVAY